MFGLFTLVMFCDQLSAVFSNATGKWVGDGGLSDDSTHNTHTREQRERLPTATDGHTS